MGTNVWKNKLIYLFQALRSKQQRIRFWFYKMKKPDKHISPFLNIYSLNRRAWESEMMWLKLLWRPLANNYLNIRRSTIIAVSLTLFKMPFTPHPLDPPRPASAIKYAYIVTIWCRLCICESKPLYLKDWGSSYSGVGGSADKLGPGGYQLTALIATENKSW